MKDAIQLLRKRDQTEADAERKQLVMPPGIMVVDSYGRQPYQVDVFNREYVRALVEKFEERCEAIHEVRAHFGRCQRFDLSNGAGVYDYGRRIHSDSDTDFEINLMLQLAKYKKWDAINLVGPNAFKRAAWLAAVMQGRFEDRPDIIGNYIPTRADREVVREWFSNMPPREDDPYVILKTHASNQNADGSVAASGRQGSKGSSWRP